MLCQNESFSWFDLTPSIDSHLMHLTGTNMLTFWLHQNTRLGFMIQDLWVCVVQSLWDRLRHIFNLNWELKRPHSKKVLGCFWSSYCPETRKVTLETLNCPVIDFRLLSGTWMTVIKLEWHCCIANDWLLSEIKWLFDLSWTNIEDLPVWSPPHHPQLWEIYLKLSIGWLE